MSNAQRRRAYRHRGKDFPGPMTPADHAAAHERAHRLTQLYALRNLARADAAPPDTPPPAIPTSGSARRRAKAARRAG